MDDGIEGCQGHAHVGRMSGDATLAAAQGGVDAVAARETLWASTIWFSGEKN